MAKPTTEELKAELQDVVNKYNQAQATVNQAQTTVKQCEKRFTELTAIINDRTTPESDAT